MSNLIINPYWDACGPEGTLDSWTLDGADNALINFTVRYIVPNVSSKGERIRVTLRSGVSEACIIDNVSIGIRSGSTSTTTATPTEILFSGGSGVTVTINSTTTSDYVNFSWAKGDDLLVVIDVSSTGGSDELRGTTGGNSGDGIYFVEGNSYDATTMPGSPTFTSNDNFGLESLDFLCDAA